MKIKATISFLTLLFIVTNVNAGVRIPSQNQLISKIAFGSCLKQEDDLSVFGAIASKHPDLFVFGGDNVYADTTNERKLISAYNTLGESKEYKEFRSVVPVVATWDDHDYGINDGGARHPTKEMSQRVFLDFFEEPVGTERRKTGGVYTSYQFGPWDKRINLILLDTRFFRSKLVRRKDKSGDKYYEKNEKPDSTILGPQQWAWLEKEIKEPATLTVIVSSIQMIPEEHRFEKWGNYPHERSRLLNLIKDSKLSNVVLVSGDRHFSELSKYELEPGKFIWEITSSGMNYGGSFGKYEKNSYRQDWVGKQGFSVLDIDWQKAGPVLKSTFYDREGRLVSSKALD